MCYEEYYMKINWKHIIMSLSINPETSSCQTKQRIVQ